MLLLWAVPFDCNHKYAKTWSSAFVIWMSWETHTHRAHTPNPLGLTWAVGPPFAYLSMSNNEHCIPYTHTYIHICIYFFIFFKLLSGSPAAGFYFKWSAFIRWQSFFSLFSFCASFHLNLRWHPADEWLVLFCCVSCCCLCLYITSIADISFNHD